jgi:hypothetical protein
MNGYRPNSIAVVAYGYDLLEAASIPVFGWGEVLPFEYSMANNYHFSQVRLPADSGLYPQRPNTFPIIWVAPSQNMSELVLAF